MANPIQAEKRVEHFAAIVPPLYVPSKMGRMVPTAPAITLDKALLPADRTFGRTHPYFHLGSQAIDPKIGTFRPSMGSSTVAVESFPACCHGDMGIFTPISGPPQPAAIYADLDQPVYQDCLADVIALLAQILKDLADNWGAFMSATLDAALDSFGNVFEEMWDTVKAICSAAVDAAAEVGGSMLDRLRNLSAEDIGNALLRAGGAVLKLRNLTAKDLMDAAVAGGKMIGEGYDKVANGLRDAYQQGRQAINEMMAELEALQQTLNEMLSDPETLLATLEELLKDIGAKELCELRDALQETAKDPANKVGQAVGEIMGIAAAEGVCTAVAALGSFLITVGTGGGGAPVAVATLSMRVAAITRRAYQVAKPVTKALSRILDPKRIKEALERAKDKLRTRPDRRTPADPKKDDKKAEDGNNTPGKRGQPDIPCLVLCNKVGRPVNALLGSKVRDGAEERDFDLPAPLPLTWQRSYNSKNARVGLLGQGWTLPLGLAVEIRPGSATVHDALGRKIRFDALAVGASAYSPFEQITLKRGGGAAQTRIALPADLAWDEQAMVVEDDGLLLYFRRPEHGRRRSLWPLRAMISRHGYVVRFFSDAEGRPHGLIDSAGRHLLFSLTRVDSDLTGDDGLRLAGVVLAYDPQRDGARGELPADPTTYPASHWLVRYDYDEAGDLVQVRDGHGRTRCRMNYRNHLMVRFGHPDGLVTEYEYDSYTPAGRVLVQRALHADGEAPAALSYQFDYQPGRTVVTDSLGRTTSYLFSGRPRTASQRWVGTIHPDGSEEQFRYDGFGHLIETIDQAGRAIRLHVDGGGRPVTIESAAGRIELQYDPAGHLLARTDTLGRRWQFAYDERGNLLEENDPLGQLTRYFYDDPQLPDRPTRVQDARGGVRHLQWHRSGQLLSQTDCSGKTTRYDYDQAGRLCAMTDALEQTMRYQYDDHGRLVAVHWPDGSTEGFAYDQLDRMVGYRDRGGVATAYRFDRAGRPLLRRDGLGHQLVYRYDPAGRLLTLCNENGAEYRFDYDLADRITEEIGFDGRHLRYRYDSAGQMVERLEFPDTPHVRRTAYRRDPLGRLVEKHSSSGTTRYRYDAAGQLLEARNRAGSVQLDYDARGRIVRETSTAEGISTTLHHRYDALGNRIASVLPDGRTLNWLHYGSGHLHQVNLDGETICDIERDDLHREILRRQGALESRFAYDRSGQLAWQGVFGRDSSTSRLAPRPIDPSDPVYGDPLAWEALGGRPTGSARLARSYRYDASGRLDQLHDSRLGIFHYRYDAIGRLLEAHHPDGRTELFAFDPAHNLLDLLNQHDEATDRKKSANSPQDIDADLREKIKELLADPEWNPLTHPLTPSPSGSQDNRLRVYQDKRFDYDRYGNLIEKRIGRHTVMRFSYDAEHQLVEARVTRNGVTQTTRYGYDPFGRRVSKRDAFGLTRFAWDGQRLLLERRGSLSRLFVYEPDSFVPMAQLELADPAAVAADDEQDDFAPPVLPLGRDERLAALQALSQKAQAQPQASGTVRIRYYHCDHLGTPRELSDGDGRLVWAAQYRAWGNTVRIDHPDLADPVERQQIEQPLRFQGQYYDAETGLHYNRFRYYDPDVGRFVSQDPIGLRGGANSYQYAPNPLGWIDPLGLSRTPFSGSCLDDVARQVLENTNAKSIRKNKEYGGLIYEKGGKYYATIPVPGTKRTFIPKFAKPQLPNGARVVGDYHTHGDYSVLGMKGEIIRTSDPMRDDFNSDNYSPADKEGNMMAAAQNKNPCHRSYLGTPSGTFKVYSQAGGEQIL
ncbi:RHS repeat-associated core domain-containing protein [Chitinimonas lacunae]|uniref:RHS repeat-associated core domain-containing protein n=1 Tax=Chitinimonas lacunae TaxID=1963018 RepID=A0ABV8MR27_9NEIS